MTNSKEDTFQRWRGTLHWTRGWRCVFWTGEGTRHASQITVNVSVCALWTTVSHQNLWNMSWSLILLTETRVSWGVPDQSLGTDWMQIQESDWRIRAVQTQEDSFVSSLQVPISIVTLLELMSASDGDALRIPTTLSMPFHRRRPFKVSRTCRLFPPRSGPPLIKHNLRGPRQQVLETKWQNPELLK